MRLPSAVAAAAFMLTHHVPPSAWAAEAGVGQIVFETKCVGCHQNGGNVLAPGKSLQLSALERNGYSTVELIAELTRNGKGQARSKLAPQHASTTPVHARALLWLFGRRCQSIRAKYRPSRA